MITTTWELIDMVVARLEAQSGPLGIKFVGAYEEKLIPRFPAVVVVPGGQAKTFHGTHTFQINATLYFYIYHANLTLTKRERSKADLQLVSKLETELDSDMGWTDETGSRRVIQGWVEQEEPGILQPRASKGDAVICTRLTWRAISQRRF
jgi:hypothetical protein